MGFPWFFRLFLSDVLQNAAFFGEPRSTVTAMSEDFSKGPGALEKAVSDICYEVPISIASMKLGESCPCFGVSMRVILGIWTKLIVLRGVCRIF